MHYFYKRHHKFIGIICSIHICNNAFSYSFGCVTLWGYGFDFAVREIFHLVKWRNVYTLDFGGFFQKFRLVIALFLVRFIKVHNLKVYLFALAKEENIDKICQRLCIASTRTACHHQRLRLATIDSFERNACQIEHIEHVGIAHFVLKRKADKIKILYWVAAFKRKKRYVFLAHNLLEIQPRRKNTLAPDILPLVKLRVENLHTKMRHTDFVSIGETKGKTHVHLCFIFNYAIDFAARISARLLYRKQQPFKFFVIHKTAP